MDVNIDLLKDDTNNDKNIKEFIQKEEEIQFSDDISIDFRVKNIKFYFYKYCI